MGSSVEVRRLDLTNWAIRTSPKLITGVKISSIRVFDQIRDPEIPVTLRSHPKHKIKMYIQHISG